MQLEDQKNIKKVYKEFASLTIDQVLANLESTRDGITSKSAEYRVRKYGHNEPVKKHKQHPIIEFLSKFFNPLIITLIVIGLFTLYYGEPVSALFIFCMIIISVVIDFVQEYRSSRDVEKLIDLVKVKATVLRDGKKQDIDIREIVPGDVVELSAGDIVPADVRIIACKTLFVNQSSLSGESLPVEKSFLLHSKSDIITELDNIAFMGTSIVNGSCIAVVLRTGRFTQFGEIATSVADSYTGTAFDRGIRDFSWLMIKLILILTIIIFGINAIFKGNGIEALIFALAVAVGLTPEMLPMLVAVNLSKGAKEMSQKEVIVKHLDTIQNLGAMDVLCTDKTGTLTQDQIILEKYSNLKGKQDDSVLRLAYLNSTYQTGLRNVLDEAVLKYKHLIVHDTVRIDEIPFDFNRRIMSVVIRDNAKNLVPASKGHNILISKGAPEELFSRCKYYEQDGKRRLLDKNAIKTVRKEYDALSSQGFRVLAVAYKLVTSKTKYSTSEESEMVLKGYVSFLDPPKVGVRKAIEALEVQGVSIKILTGDNELVTRQVCNEVGLVITGALTGEDIENHNDIELRDIVEKANIFTRLTPLQKRRIINALQSNGHIVGFLGDGINDSPTLKGADVGISVNNAVDIAKESAGIVLLNKNLMVLSEGVKVGRKTFGNLVKYIRMGASSNFGNMFSMAGASLFLPFLPMLPVQILLNNFLYDLSQLVIPTDNVDEEFLEKPRPWNIDHIRHFMITIGPISSIFDFITFMVLLWIFSSDQAVFQTSWFLESLLSQVLVIHIIRTNKIPFFESRPSNKLIIASVVMALIGLILTTTSLGKIFGFVQLSAVYVLTIFLICAIYFVVVFLVKNELLKRYSKEWD